MRLAAALLASCSLVQAGLNPFVTTCPEVSTMTDFEPSWYAGTWYEIIRDKSTPFEINNECVVADYTVREDGTLGVRNSGWGPRNGWHAIEGQARQVGDDDSGELHVSFEGMPESEESLNEPNYFVLDTDYDSYAIVYSCNNLYGYLIFDLLWVLSKTPTMSDD